MQVGKISVHSSTTTRLPWSVFSTAIENHSIACVSIWETLRHTVGGSQLGSPCLGILLMASKGFDLSLEVVMNYRNGDPFTIVPIVIK